MPTHGRIGKRRIHFAVRLPCVRRSDRYWPLRDRQLAVLRLHRELLRYNVAIGVLHDRSAGHDRGVFARVRSLRARAQAFHRVGVVAHFERRAHKSAYALLRAVVLRRGAIRNYLDLVLLCVLRGVGDVAGDRFLAGRRPVGEVVAFFGSYSGGVGGGGAFDDVGVDDLAVVVIVACQRAMVALLIGDCEGLGVVELYLYHRSRRLRHQILFAVFDVVESVAGDGLLVDLRLDGIADLFGDGLRFRTRYGIAVLINMVDGIGDRAIGSIVEDNLPQASRDRGGLDLLNRVVVLIPGHRRGDRLFYDALDFGRGSHRLRLRYFRFRTLHVVVDGVFLVLPLRVVECNDVLAGVDVEVDALGHRIDAIARDRGGAGRDGLTLRERIAADDLRGKKLLPILIDIPHRILKGVLLPARIDDHIFRNGLVDVEGRRGRAVRKPTAEGVADTGGRRQGFDLFVVDDLNGRRLRAIVTFVVHQRHRARRRGELGVEREVVGGHGCKGVGLAQALGVVIPVGKGIVGGQAYRCGRGMPVVGIAADVRAEVDGLEILQHSRAIAVGDGVLRPGVVEVVDINPLISRAFELKVVFPTRTRVIAIRLTRVVFLPY